jgi:hypothetical protein
MSDHLYSVGTRKRMREVTISGAPAVDILCWPFIKGQPCNCDGMLAHIFPGGCGKAISGALGACEGCDRGAQCGKPHPDSVLESLTAWHEETLGPVELGTVSVVAAHLQSRGGVADAPLMSRSTRTALGLSDEQPPRCTVPPAAVLQRLQRHAEGKAHVQRLLDEPFVHEMLGVAAERRLLAQRVRPLRLAPRMAHATALATALATGLSACAWSCGCGPAVVVLRLWRAGLVQLDST